MSHDADSAALVGIDGADTTPDFCVRALGAEQEAYGVMGQLPDAMAHGAKGLAARWPGRKLAVGREPAQGRLIEALLTSNG
jgi:hypothetical protein